MKKNVDYRSETGPVHREMEFQELFTTAAAEEPEPSLALADAMGRN